MEHGQCRRVRDLVLSCGPRRCRECHAGAPSRTQLGALRATVRVARSAPVSDRRAACDLDSGLGTAASLLLCGTGKEAARPAAWPALWVLLALLTGSCSSRRPSDSDSGLGTAASLLHSRSKEAARPDVPPLGRGSDTAARRQGGLGSRLSERPVANLRWLEPVCRGGWLRDGGTMAPDSLGTILACRLLWVLLALLTVGTMQEFSLLTRIT